MNLINEERHIIDCYDKEINIDDIIIAGKSWGAPIIGRVTALRKDGFVLDGKNICKLPRQSYVVTNLVSDEFLEYFKCTRKINR